MAKHGDACKDAGIVFRPLPMNTLGIWSDTLVTNVRRIGSALARQTAGEEGEVTRHLIKGCSCSYKRKCSDDIK